MEAHQYSVIQDKFSVIFCYEIVNISHKLLYKNKFGFIQCNFIMVAFISSCQYKKKTEYFKTVRKNRTEVKKNLSNPNKFSPLELSPLSLMHFHLLCHISMNSWKDSLQLHHHGLLDSFHICKTVNLLELEKSMTQSQVSREQF